MKTGIIAEKCTKPQFSPVPQLPVTKYLNRLTGSLMKIHFMFPGIAHRDLKPENILCACENQVS